MNINKENLLKKSYNDFEVICNFIGLSILKNFFLSECKNSMKTCKYYIGKINGKYWNGFRPSTISLKKICEVLFLEKSGSEINVEKIIDNSIKEKLNIKNDENLEKEIKEINDYNVLLILSNIYDIVSQMPLSRPVGIYDIIPYLNLVPCFPFSQLYILATRKKVSIQKKVSLIIKQRDGKVINLSEI